MWDAKGKCVVITGTSSGIGKEVARELRELGAHLITIGREVESQYIADLSVLSDVVRVAREIAGNETHIDALINIAGVMPTEKIITKDGYELNLAVNAFAPVLLTELLQSSLEKGARVLTVVSSMHREAQIDPTDPLRLNAEFNRYASYAHSKKLVMLALGALARKHTDLNMSTVHPGWVRTPLAIKTALKSGTLPFAINFFRMKSAKSGAQVVVSALTADDDKFKKTKYFGAYPADIATADMGNTELQDLALSAITQETSKFS